MAGSCLNVKVDPVTLDYHLKQWNEPYRSTVHFAEFLKDKLELAHAVVDVGCGSGGPTGYLASEFPHVQFTGIDISSELIGHAKRARNLDFETDNLESLRVRFGIDGVIGIQMLHTLPNAGLPIHQIATRIRPQWMAFSTLIYEGNINCQILVEEPERPKVSYYNIFGLPTLTEVCRQEGYRAARYKKFNIDVDLPKPQNPDLMASYTIATSQSRLLCSGPLLLPWGFVLFERDHGNTN